MGCFGPIFTFKVFHIIIHAFNMKHKYTPHLVDEPWPPEQLWLKSLISAPGHHSVRLSKIWLGFVYVSYIFLAILLNDC